MRAIFKNSSGELRSGWWIVLYMALLATCLFPTILISAHFHREVGIWEQTALIGLVTFVCQGLRRRSFFEVTGVIDVKWFRQLAMGLVIGGLLMAIPALVLLASHAVTFSTGDAKGSDVLMAIVAMAGVAVAEELLFRGFLFQRMIEGLGKYLALLLLAGLFLLTHFDNAGMKGSAAILAGANIFIAGLMFGLAFLVTRRLALPIGIHFGANVVQGNILGFAVSGTGSQSFLIAQISSDAQWLTGGAVGLEGSLPGLLTLLVLIGALLWVHKRKANRDVV